MRFVSRLVATFGCLAVPLAAGAYPGGTPNFVTDVAPFCTSCHSSVSADQLLGVPELRVQKELAAAKHISQIRQALEGSAYAKLSPEQRDQLIRGIEAIDAASRVELIAPSTIKAGQVFEVTIKATGGGGPVVGLALVDSNQRWQARPAASAGWHVVSAPRVVGPDGGEQTRFTEQRTEGLAPGISYVNVYGVRADPIAGQFDSVQATFRLRAPPAAGTYPLAAVFLYGTEKASPHGGVETVRGVVPLGGFGGASGRVRFSPVAKISVQ